MNIKAITLAALVGAFALGCSTDTKKEEKDQGTAHSSDTANTSRASLNKMRTGNGPGTGTGSASGTGTGTPGTGTGPGINSTGDHENRMISNGTGTEPKKADTGLKRGKWPTQGDPFS